MTSGRISTADARYLVSRTRRSGFTLLELVITLVVISILAAIAFPTYTNFVRKSRRADATQSLSFYQSILERCYAVNFNYTGNCPALPTSGSLSTKKFYTMTYELTATTYALHATATGSQAADSKCQSLSVDQTNARTQSPSNSTVCWQ